MKMTTVFDLAEKGDFKEIANGKWTKEELDYRGEDGRTALMRAALRGDYKVLEVLRSAGADLDLKDNEGRKAVNLAALHGHSIAIVYLIEGGCGG